MTKAWYWLTRTHVFQAQVDRMSRAFDAAFTHFCDQTVGQQK
jgi:hypothetical protein